MVSKLRLFFRILLFQSCGEYVSILYTFSMWLINVILCVGAFELLKGLDVPFGFWCVIFVYFVLSILCRTPSRSIVNMSEDYRVFLSGIFLEVLIVPVSLFIVVWYVMRYKGK